ncbi:MAG: hypothetical protein ACXIUP_03020 [Microcella sp.]
MSAFSAPFGLLLDVDGPIASPVARRIVEPSILPGLVTLASAGVPIAFVTGRSAVFVRDEVAARLVEAGLPHGAPVFAVMEKGGAWAPITTDGLGELEVDAALAIPADVTEAVHALARAEYAHAMEVDEGKHVMISLEARADIPHEEYVPAQAEFQERVWQLLVDRGLGLRYGDREHADAQGEVPWRIDPTIISTDVESVRLDKDRGAARALEWFAAHGATAPRWYSAGDSRSDYLMADHVHADGLEAVHVDVRPSDGMLAREYPVITMGSLIHDEAGAKFLRERVAELGL